MSLVANFVVTSNRCCSCCARDAKHVVHVPFSRNAAAEQIDFCAYCVLAMAKALAQAQGQPA